jgi:bacillopeptidase F (M6 metalloprotease family)
VWIDTEGSTYDGANLKISTDGGATYTIVTNVTPAYSLTVNTEPAWGGHQASSGWQLVRADLTPYVGHDVRLRVAFRSDGSGTYPGVYVDDVWVTR